MTRTRMITIGGALAVAATLAATGIAEASASGHHGHHGHGRVGDDVWSSHHSERYGQDYGVLGGLIWEVGHLI